MTTNEAMKHVIVIAHLRDGGDCALTCNAFNANKLANCEVHSFTDEDGRPALFVRYDPKGNKLGDEKDNGSDKDGMSVFRYLGRKGWQCHFRDGDPFNCTIENFGTRHEKYYDRKENRFKRTSK